AGRTGDEVGLHRPAREGARPAPEIRRHGHRAVFAEVRAYGRGGARDPRRDHRAAARTPVTLAGDRGRVRMDAAHLWPDLSPASWPGLSRPSTSLLHWRSKTWMPATSAGMTVGRTG